MIKLWQSSQILKKDETLQVRREQIVTYKDGKPVKNGVVWFSLVTNVQPVPGHDLLLVPEHDRFREQFILYYNNAQFSVDKGISVEGISNLTLSDIIVRQGNNYEVQSVDVWGTYSKARIMRVDVGPNATP